MKKTVFYLILGIGSLLIIPGCKKALTEHPKSFVSPSNFFQTADEDEASVNAIYSVLYSFFSSWQFLEETDGTSDLMWVNVGTSFDGTFSYDPSAPGFGASVWEYGYRGVLYANNTIYGIEHSPVDSASKKSMIAEAKFLRALYYFFLTNTFGAVPYWT
ncbi:MAG: RagB/SusD family nutrient uptake outer membrane protein, partial [Rhabdochlamydiaceae bacterium]